MFEREQNIGLNGLTGFWGDLWNGFKSKFTKSVMDDNPNTIAGLIGRRISDFLTSQISYYTGGLVTFKEAEYVPTAQDLLLLNPLKIALNNYMIALVKAIDVFFLANTNTQARIDYLNNAIRKIQIVQTYFLLNNHPSLSVNAQQNLSESIIDMIKSFELTIEELLNQNGIAYTKTEGDLAVSSADTYPVGINIPANEYGYGYQYKVPNTETGVISTDVPTSAGTANVSLTPSPSVVTTVVAGGEQSKNNGLVIAVALFAFAALVAAFSPKETKSK